MSAPQFGSLASYYQAAEEKLRLPPEVAREANSLSVPSSGIAVRSVGSQTRAHQYSVLQ